MKTVLNAKGLRSGLPEVVRRIFFHRLHQLILMRELKLRGALTTEPHFLQAGFGIKP